MRFPLLACAVVAACGANDPVGITVEFVSPPGVDSIELFVAKPCTKSCDGRTGPPNVGPIEGARQWEVPHEGTGPFVISATEALLLVNDREEDQTIEMLAAVGYDGSGTAVAAYMHFEPILLVAGQTEHWRLTLSPATDIVPGEDAPDATFRARRWRRSDETMPSCAVIEKGHDRYAFGPIGDRDCDEMTTTEEAECAPWVHRAEGVMPAGAFGAAVCGKSMVLDAAFPPACLAGGRACNEVSGSSDLTCSPLTDQYCVPTQLCECPTWDSTCVRGKLAVPPPSSSYIKCTVCVADPEFPEFTLAPILGSGSSTNVCSDVRMHEVASTLGPLDNTATFSTSVLEITGTNGCNVTMKWTGTAPATTDVAVVSIDLLNGNHIVVPLYVEYAPLCDLTAQVCTAYPAAADPARLCSSPPAPSTCGGDAICNGGQWCGNQCCRYGERCEAGVCMCGLTGSACPDGEVCGGGTPSADYCGTECCGSTGPNACI